MYELITINKTQKRNKFLKITFVIIAIIFLIISLNLFYKHIYNEEMAKISASTQPITSHSIIASIEPILAEKKEFLFLKNGLHPFAEEQCNNIINIYSSQTEKTVFLTFDDGPSKSITPLILDVLKQQNIKATFFVLGTNAQRYPDILKRAHNEGHFIANHGYSHKYSEIYENTDTILNDFNQCQQIIRNILELPEYNYNVYRFPGGSNGGKYHEIKNASKEVLKQNKIAYLDWNALTYDAEGSPTKESILENLQITVGNKNVVVLLMHDSAGKILTYETLPEVIKFFQENGYTFKTLYDVL